MQRLKHNFAWALGLGLSIGVFLAILSHGTQPLALAIATVYLIWVIFETQGFNDLMDGYSGRRPPVPDYIERFYTIERISLTAVSITLCVVILSNIALMGVTNLSRLLCVSISLIGFVGLPTLAWIAYFHLRKLFRENPPERTPRHWQSS